MSKHVYALDSSGKAVGYICTQDTVGVSGFGGPVASVVSKDSPDTVLDADIKAYRDSKKQAQDAARVSLKAKLLALGLTADEVKELGV